MEDSPNLIIPAELMDLTDLRRQAEELRLLCDRFDPFSCAIDLELQVLLRKYVPWQKGDDPFPITNKLILLLENTLQALQQREENVEETGILP